MRKGKQRSKSRSNRTLLVQQVEDQSDFCDVNIKVGAWEKKFHRCVLAASPFLFLLMKHSDKEKDKATIEIKIGRPTSVEEAVMYLYGKKPKLNIENVESLFELAEFFLLPNLKSFCYSWLKSTTFNKENCMQMLMLSSRYGFEIKACTYYIEAHLPEIFQNELSFHLTKDSVKYLISESILSYVPMNTRLQFLMKWLCFTPEREAYGAELCGQIDFGDIDLSLLEQVRLRIMDKNIQLSQHATNSHQHEATKRKALILKRVPNYSGSYICLDFETERWSRLETRAVVESLNNEDISGVRKGSEIYLWKQFERGTISGVDLETNTLCKYDVNFREGYLHSPNNVLLKGSIYICTTNEHGLYEFGSFTCSTLYVGHVLEDNSVDLASVLTLRSNMISKICLNRMFILAMKLLSKDYIFLYSITTCKLEKVPLKKEFEQIEPTDEGFVAFDNTTAVFVQVLEDSFYTTSRKCEYRLRYLKFDHEPNSAVKYYFCDRKWFRCFNSKEGEVVNFEYTSVEDSVTPLISPKCRNIAWKSLPLPMGSVIFSVRNIGDRLHVIELPKYKLGCHLDCPHCSFANHCGDTNTESGEHGHYFDSSDDNSYEAPTVIARPIRAGHTDMALKVISEWWM